MPCRRESPLLNVDENREPVCVSALRYGMRRGRWSIEG